jgi:ABC-2 type transport system ATP-binding protein
MRDMRALVKRLAKSGLTVLLSSHDMNEVEEICDNVTIMRTGSVVFHGEIDDLREQAPGQGHHVVTTDDERALAYAGGHPDLNVERHPHGGLLIRGPQRELDAYIAAIVAHGIALRRLELTEAPLEALFFMLTESAPGGVPVELASEAA